MCQCEVRAAHRAGALTRLVIQDDDALLADTVHVMDDELGVDKFGV